MCRKALPRIVAVILVAGMSAAVMLSLPSLLLFGRVVVGCTAACPLSESIEIFSNTRCQTRISDGLASASDLLKRDPGGYELWKTPKGLFWIPQARLGSYYLFQMLAEEERKVYGRSEYGVQPGDVVLDCGANVGAFTREALNLGAKLVVAIEPAPDNLTCLKRNFGDEIADGRVVLYGKGVWDEDAEMVLSANEWSSGGYSFTAPGPSGKNGLILPLTTIDKVVSELDLQRVDLIKMDVEGAERRALLGAKRTLATQKPRLAIAAEHSPDDTEIIPKLVHSLSQGYTTAFSSCVFLNGQVRREAIYFR